ncbi:hypothetical protein V8F20_010061 [Naviculisporaceae sp. PSN 640]
MAKVGDWASLPRELQLQIFEHITHQDGCPPRHLAPLTSVCKDWQEQLEPAIFGEMRLLEGDIKRFGQIIARSPERRQMVRKICLGIDVAPTARTHRCQDLRIHKCCRHGDSPPPGPQQRYWAQLDSLIQLLSTWTVKSKSKSCGIELDITIFSSESRKQGYNRLRCRRITTNSYVQGTNSYIGETNLSWYDKLPVFLGDDVEEKMLYGLAVEVPAHSSSEPYLPVPIVRKLVLRRETRTQWKANGIIRLLQHFPLLEEMHYEPWREYRRAHERRTGQERFWLWKSFIENKSLKSLKRVVLFEDFLDNHHSTLEYESRSLRPNNSAAVACGSLRLVELSASYMVDAMHFFQARHPTWDWLRLEKLALTAQALSEGSHDDPEEANCMLREAAAAAMRMPRLQTLEIWNGRKGLAGAFQYHYQLRGCEPPLATVTWRGTWDLYLARETIQSWRAVAEQRFGDHAGQFEVFHETYDGAIGTHDEAIRFLNLKSQVVSPISLSQIREENSSALRTSKDKSVIKRSEAAQTNLT